MANGWSSCVDLGGVSNSTFKEIQGYMFALMRRTMAPHIK